MNLTIESLRLRDDMILARPIEMTYKSLVLPKVDTIRADRPGDAADTFLAEVVAVGPGDRLLHGKCGQCGAEKQILVCRGKGFSRCSCGSSDWQVTGESRMPMQVKPGDKVLIPRRPSGPNGVDTVGDCAILIGGERFLMFAEEQFALAVVD